jgi:hypothetical protein
MAPTSRPSKEDSNDTRTVILTLAVAALVAGIAFIGIRALQGGGGKPPGVQVATTVSGAAVAGVAVAVPSVDLGSVPLNQDVNQTFTLKNSGTGKAQLGIPRIETLEGC